MSYAAIIKNNDPGAYTGGYKNVFVFAERAKFLSIKKPVGPFTNIGDKLKIATAHTFTSPDGFISWDTKQHSVTLKATTVGEDGAQELEWAGTFNILGDSASNQEQLMAILNDDIIALIKEADCLVSDSYVQLGDECVSPSFKVEFDGKTTKEGKKEYVVTVTCKKKFFYTGVVTMATVEE